MICWSYISLYKLSVQSLMLAQVIGTIASGTIVVGEDCKGEILMEAADLQ